MDPLPNYAGKESTWSYDLTIKNKLAIDNINKLYIKRDEENIQIYPNVLS